jgi:DNA-binding XRE family transcriptional regulator
MTYIETTLESRRILAKNVEDYLNSNLKHKTMDELGAACDSNKQQIFKIKTEKINPSLEFLDKLAKAMDCSVQDLFTERFFEKKTKKR